MSSLRHSCRTLKLLSHSACVSGPGYQNVRMRMNICKSAMIFADCERKMPRAPKPFLPPQGGEKWLCIFTFLFMMFRFTPASSQSDTSIIKVIIIFTFHTIVFLLWLLLSISFSCNNSYFHFLVITLTFTFL